MRVLVCGGRDDTNYIRVFLLLHELWNDYKFDTLINGGANGVDEHARNWAIYHELSSGNPVSIKLYPAKWKEHGKAAGPIRNQQMLDEGKPDLVVAFPGGSGTADMVRRAKKAGVKVVEID